MDCFKTNKWRRLYCLRLCNFICFCLILSSVILTGCSSGKKNSGMEFDNKDAELPVEEVYNKAADELEAKKYQAAVEGFENVERLHPYSIWATKAQLLVAFAHYKSNQYDNALLSLDRFISLHPANKDISYAYYLKALCYYEQISDVARDQEMTQLALNAFKELLARFPASNYSKDGKLKLDLIYDHLAGKEMEIGRYYHKQSYYLAAINRFKSVVEQYQTTTHVAEALHRLTECYRAIGLSKEAQRTAAVLGFNFPESNWYTDSYKMLTQGNLQKKNDPIIENIIKKKAKSKKSWYQFW